MYRRIGNCETCGAPFAARPGEDIACTFCGAGLPSALDDVGLGKASLHQLLGEAFVREDWASVLEIVERITSQGPSTPRIGRYLFFAGSVADRKLRDQARSLLYFERAASADEAWLTPLAARAEIFARHGEYRSAERELRAAIRRAQESDVPAAIMRSLWATLGELLRDHMNDPEQARLCFELAERRASSALLLGKSMR